MFKRLFWFLLGYSAGAVTVVLCFRKIKRTMRKATQRFEPSRLVADAVGTVKDLADTVVDEIRTRLDPPTG